MCQLEIGLVSEEFENISNMFDNFTEQVDNRFYKHLFSRTNIPISQPDL